ncbi:MAG: hypothetical protein LBH44_01095 [Treponema sp.]|jgi:hypothetical protein|nr:hypothetical protein [Treponema sp.]
MTDIKGHIVGWDDKEYFVICPKTINNCELYIAVTVPHLPQDFKLLELQEGDDGKIQGCLYAGEYHQELFQGFAQEINEAMKEIREGRQTQG